jgi:hypothetical protein
MAPLLGIQIWSVGRKPMHLDLGMCLHIRFDHLRAMGIEPVPDDDEGARNVPLEVTEGDHDVIAADGPREVSLVDATRQGSPDDRGEVTTLADAPQDRGLPLRSPCGPRLGTERKACLIDKYYLRPRTLSLFLIWGQSCMSQAWTSASLRSRA